MSKVYFTNLRTENGHNLLDKLKNLIAKAGMGTIDFKNQFVAIKIHFGEPGNLAYLRPNYSRVIVDYIKEKGGYPFLTDCNTLYVGRRNQGINHLDAAYENGYNPFMTNCHTIIADGIKGTDESYISVGLPYIKEAKIGRAIADADIIISMNHFKGHESAGFGGALKNIGMGSGSRAGKMEMHNSGKPSVDSETCQSCGRCKKNCAQDAISFGKDKKAMINHDKCVGCGRCIGVCPYNAIYTNFDETNEILNYKIAEYTYAVLKDKPNFHINFVIDVSPTCDCASNNDVAIVPNIGILASFDPVALDMACADLVNQAPALKNTALKEESQDKFHSLHPTTHGKAMLEHGVAIGLGEMEYELIEI